MNGHPYCFAYPAYYHGELLFINWNSQFVSKESERLSYKAGGMVSWRLCCRLFNVCWYGNPSLVGKCLPFLYCPVFLRISPFWILECEDSREKLVNDAYWWDGRFLYRNHHSSLSCKWNGYSV